MNTLTAAAVATWPALVAVAVLQARRIGRLNAKLRDQGVAAGELALGMHDAMAENDRLTGELQDLRDENVELLRSWVTGETA